MNDTDAAVYLTSHPNDPAPCPRCGDPWCIYCEECDCPMDPHHRWNCALTPIWAHTIRELDCNPWGRWSSRDVHPSINREGQV